MDIRAKAVDVIREYYEVKTKHNASSFLLAVCEYFDSIKDLKIENGDLEFLAFISSIAGIPQYMTLLERNYSSNLPEVHSLYSEGFATELYKSSLSTGSGMLHKYQKQVLDNFKNSQTNRIVLSAPTSFGKTFLVYEIIHKMNYQNVVLIFPTIALLSENYEKLLKGMPNTYFRDFKLHTLSDDSQISERNIWLFTPERFLSYCDKNNCARFDFIFFDEFYKIDNGYVIDIETVGENERDIAFRIALEYGCQSSQDLLLAGPYIDISSDPKNSFANFINENGFRVLNYNSIEIVKKTIITIGKSRNYIIDNLTIHCGRGSIAERTCNVLSSLLSYKENVIIYNNRKAGVERQAKAIISRLNITNEVPEEKKEAFRAFIKHLERIFGNDWVVIKALKKGIGIHHGLVPKYIQREIINLFNDGVLNVLISTTTITEGVNTSAKNIIITSDKKGTKPLKSFDAKNIAGRAGRFLYHYSGRVIVIDNDFEKVMQNSEGAIKHKNYDENSYKSRVDYQITQDKYLTVEDKQKKADLDQEIRKRGISAEIVNSFKVIDPQDKITIYDKVSKLSAREKDRISRLISRLNFHVDGRLCIDTDGLQCIIDIISPIINDSKLKFLAEQRCKNNDQMSIITALVFFYLRDGFLGLFRYNMKSDNTSTDQAMRKTSEMVYNTFKYQLVKYLGIFDLIYKNIKIKESNATDNNVTGITRLLDYLEHSAFSKKAQILSDYGVPFRLIEYYEKPGADKNFDGYEKIIDKRIAGLIED